MREELIKIGGDVAALADSPLLFPDDGDEGPAPRVRRHARRARPDDHRPVRHDHRGLTRWPLSSPTTGRSATARWAPYLMSLPGLLCLYLFFIVPLVTLLKMALSVRVESGSTNVDFQWEWCELLGGVHRVRRASCGGRSPTPGSPPCCAC